VVGPAVAAGIGGIGASQAPQVYRDLEKPAWAPPAGVFGPVWTGLYTAIGVGGFRLARRDARSALRLHAIQLALNAAWPLTFFSGRNKRASLAVIVALDVVVAAELIAAAREDRVAAGLLSPYLGWCLFATALDAAVGRPRTP
jgi:tryptophan-rich sensory protein